MKLCKNFVCHCLSVFFLTIFSGDVFADKYKAEMQNSLNAQVMGKPFDVPDDATLSKSLNEATERGKPTKSKSKDNYYRYWYNGFYYPHPYTYYGYPRYWY